MSLDPKLVFFNTKMPSHLQLSSNYIKEPNGDVTFSMHIEYGATKHCLGFRLYGESVQVTHSMLGRKVENSCVYEVARFKWDHLTTFISAMDRLPEEALMYSGKFSYDEINTEDLK